MSTFYGIYISYQISNMYLSWFHTLVITVSYDFYHLDSQLRKTCNGIHVNKWSCET
jgi:hypothetical protein